MDIQQYMATVGEQARGASRAMARATAGDKNAALSAIAGALRAHRSAILDANQRDLARGR
ncbi:MAG TPA: gamma-glutamyl-phosphate reductase, partial [Alcanivorax sp.]|nr:gamma-glutamyl-phosphate reductase [Alcanivorax sp.]